MERIKSQLENLKAIAPDREFVARAKLQILGVEKPMALSLPRHVTFPRISAWSWLGAGLSAALVAVITILPLAYPEPTLSASLNPETLANEYGNLPINIQLKEITYQQAVNKTIASALSEVGDTKTTHLNTNILMSELEDSAPLNATDTEDIDSMLNNIIN